MHHIWVLYYLCTKIIWTSLAKNEVQDDFSTKFSKKLVFLIERPSNNAHSYDLNLKNHSKAHCIDGGMNEELGTIFFKFFEKVVTP